MEAKEKTAMMQMLKWVDDNYPNFNKAEIEAKIEELLATEKQQHIDTWHDAFRKGFDEDFGALVTYTGEQYYQEQFNPSPPSA